jgi:hypothetical protein
METNSTLETKGDILAGILPYAVPRVRCGLDANDEVIDGANCVGLDVSFGLRTDQLQAIVKIFDTPPDYGWPWAVASLGNNVLDTLTNPTLWLGTTSVTLASQNNKADRTLSNVNDSYNTNTAIAATSQTTDTVRVSRSLNSQSISDTREFGDFDNIGNTTRDSGNDQSDNSDNSTDCLDGCGQEYGF